MMIREINFISFLLIITLIGCSDSSPVETTAEGERLSIKEIDFDNQRSKQSGPNYLTGYTPHSTICHGKGIKFTMEWEGEQPDRMEWYLLDPEDRPVDIENDTPSHYGPEFRHTATGPFALIAVAYYSGETPMQFGNIYNNIPSCESTPDSNTCPTDEVWDPFEGEDGECVSAEDYYEVD